VGLTIEVALDVYAWAFTLRTAALRPGPRLTMLFGTSLA
jgi:hypothetical protein